MNLSLLKISDDIIIIISIIIIIFLLSILFLIIRIVFILPTIEKVVLKKLKNNEFDEIIETVENYFKNQSVKNDKIDNYLFYYLALAYENKAQYDKALEYYLKIYTKFIKQKKFYIHILIKIANLYNKIGNYKEAFAFYLMVLENNKNSPEALYEIANYYYNNKNLSKAIDTLEKLLKLKPGLIDARILFSKVCFDAGNYLLSLKKIELIEKHYIDLELKFLKAKILEKLRRFTEAIKLYKEIVYNYKNEINTNLKHKKIINESLINITYIFYKIKDYNSGISIIKDFIDIIDDKKILIEIYYLYANLLLNNLEEYFALEIYEKVYNIDPNYKDIKVIYEKYKNILQLKYLKNYFISNELNFDNFCKKIINDEQFVLVYKSNDYFIYSKFGYYKIFYRHIEPINYSKLTDIEILIDSYEYKPQFIEIYSLNGVQEDCLTHFLLKLSIVIKENDFNHTIMKCSKNIKF